MPNTPPSTNLYDSPFVVPRFTGLPGFNDRPDLFECVKRTGFQVVSRIHYGWYQKYRAVDQQVLAADMNALYTALSETASVLANNRMVTVGGGIIRGLSGVNT